MSKKILLIDDDKSAMHYLVESLKEFYGFTVKWETDTDKVFAKEITPNNYDILILDIMMPVAKEWSNEEKNEAESGMATGLVILRKIRKNNADIPILVYSARDADISAYSNAFYLRKPESIETIANTIEELLQKK